MQTVPSGLVCFNTLGPQMVELFPKILEYLGGEASFKEVGHWG